MKKISITGLSIFLAFLSGCTTSLDTRPSFERTVANKALPGIDYSLPMLTYEIDIAYKLLQCVDPATGNPDVKFKIEAIAASDYIAGERYTVDYEALSSPLKSTDFSIGFHEDSGTLKTLNASASDKTADVIKSAVKLGISAASIAAGAPPLPAIAGAAQASEDERSTAIKNAVDTILSKLDESALLNPSCTADAKTALQNNLQARVDFKQAGEELEQLAKEAEFISQRASVDLASTNDKRRFLRVHRDILVKSAEMNGYEKTMIGTEKAISHLSAIVWPRDPFDATGLIMLPSDGKIWLRKIIYFDAAAVSGKINQLLNNKIAAGAIAPNMRLEVEKKIQQIVNLQQTNEKCSAFGFQDDCTTLSLAQYAKLERWDPLPAAACDSNIQSISKPCLADSKSLDARKFKPHKGVFVRETARGRLVLTDLVRKTSDSESKEFELHESPALKTDWDRAPQLGQLRFIPMKNSTFQDNALVLTLREDGTIEKFLYKESKAIAAEALAAASEVAAAIDAEIDKREQERKDAIKAARDNIAWERSERIAERAEVASGRTEIAAQRSEAAAIRADEIAQLQYEIDLIEKQKKLTELRTPAPASPPSIVDKDFENETIRLEAVLRQLTAKLAIKIAEAEFAAN